MPHATTSNLSVLPVEHPGNHVIDFGAEIRGADLENLTGMHSIVRDTVIVIQETSALTLH